MRRIYLVVSAGFPNYGDELICAQWLRHLAVRHPNAEVWVDSPSPGGAQLLLGHLHPHVRFVDTVFQIAWAAPTDQSEEVSDFAREAVRHPGVVPRRAAGVDLLHEVDVFHVLGGGYINALWPRHVAILAAGATLAAEFGVRVALTGAGMMQAAAPASVLQRLTADYVVADVRDADSRELVSGVQASASGDDVFYPFVEVWGRGLPARPQQRWLTTRFHVHLVAAARGASGSYISVSPGYYDVKHESLVSRGSGWSMVEPGSAASADGGGDGFPSGTRELTLGKRAVAERVYAP